MEASSALLAPCGVHDTICNSWRTRYKLQEVTRYKLHDTRYNLQQVCKASQQHPHHAPDDHGDILVNYDHNHLRRAWADVILFPATGDFPRFVFPHSRPESQASERGGEGGQRERESERERIVGNTKKWVMLSRRMCRRLGFRV
jgi:hypothetical protein